MFYQESSLTPKQQAFVNNYLKSGNATEAYAKAYGVKSVPVAAANASRLLSNAKIAAAVAKAQSKLSERVELNQAAVLEGLKKEATREEGGKHAARVSAWMGIAKILGFVVEKTETKSEHNGTIKVLFSQE